MKTGKGCCLGLEWRLEEGEGEADGTLKTFDPEAVGVLGPSEELSDLALLWGVSGVEGGEGVESGTEKRAIAVAVSAGGLAVR